MSVSCQDLDLLITASAASGRRRRRRPFASLWEAIVIAADSIYSHKMRSVLTLLGIIIGVASVVTVGGAIEGLGYYVRERLVSTFGSNAFMVARIARINISGDEWEKLSKRNKVLYIDDMEAVRQLCPDCEAISPNLSSTDDVKVADKIFYDASINGVSPQVTKIQDLIVAEGRFLSNYDTQRSRPVAVIGSAIQDEVFGPIDPLGKQIKVGGDEYTVIGIEQENGSFFGQSMDNNVYIPYTSFMKKYGTRRSISFRVKAPSDDMLQTVEDQVRVVMRTRHKLRPGAEDDFDILGSEALQEAVGQFTGAIAAVVTPVTLISLVVGGIVVMNIMLVSVTERTQEIGMRKAIGARRTDILLQFLVESSMLASIGGAIGLLVAYGLGIIIRNTTPVPIHITLSYIILALLASGGIGLISGIYPAHRAAKLDPIVALTRE